MRVHKNFHVYIKDLRIYAQKLQQMNIMQSANNPIVEVLRPAGCSCLSGVATYLPAMCCRGAAV